MIEKKAIDRKIPEQRHRLVKVESIKHKEAREIGTDPIAIGWICANT